MTTNPMSARDVARAALPADPYDALRIENDVLGVRVWGPPTQPTLSVGKADIWDRRWFGDRQPLITLSQIRDLAARDKLAKVARSPNDTVYDVYNRYDFPCPKPGAQVILGTPFATTAAAELTADGEVRLLIEGPGKTLRASVWVALARPLVIIELETQGLTPEDVWVRLYRHRDTIIPAGPADPSLGGKPSPADFEQLSPPLSCHTETSWGIVQSFPAEPTFPDGFSFAAAATALCADVTVMCRHDARGFGTKLWAEKEGVIRHGLAKRYSPINDATGAAATARFNVLPPSFAIIATIATTQDGPDPTSAAREILDEARRLGVEGLRQEQAAAVHQAQRHRPAHALIGGAPALSAPAVVRPNLRRTGGYYGDIPLCSVDSTKFCFQDSSPWHADFHLNELRAEPMLTLGQFEELLPYCEMIRTLLPQAQENARDVYDLPGAMYPLVHFPLRCRGIAHTNLTWEQDLGLNGLVTKPLWLYYRYTGDAAFLRDIAWPVLCECARFMAAYLTEESDGRLHIVPTVSPEHWGLTARFERDRDCLSALTLTRYLLVAAADAAEAVGQATAETAAWRVAAQRLAPYPTYETEAGPIWVDVAGAPPIEYNIPVPLAAIFWGDDVGLDSPPESLVIAKRTLEHIDVWQPHRGYLNGCVAPRLGMWRAGATIGPENLLLSYQSIRLFPAVPPNTEIIITDFAAQGGFRISATRTRDGDTQGVHIRSLLGERCRVANPWPGREVAVLAADGSQVACTDAGATHLTFATRPGDEYELRAP